MKNQYPPIELERFVSPRELQNALNVSRAQIYRLIHNGTLTAVRLPGTRTIRIRATEIDRYLDQINQQQEPTHEGNER